MGGITPRRGKGVTSVCMERPVQCLCSASRGRQTSDGAACGQWVGVLSSKRCIFGTVKGLGVCPAGGMEALVLKWTFKMDLWQLCWIDKQETLSWFKVQRELGRGKE